MKVSFNAICVRWDQARKNVSRSWTSSEKQSRENEKRETIVEVAKRLTLTKKANSPKLCYRHEEIKKT